jgi:TIR domain
MSLRPLRRLIGTDRQGLPRNDPPDHRSHQRRRHPQTWHNSPENLTAPTLKRHILQATALTTAASAANGHRREAQAALSDAAAPQPPVPAASPDTQSPTPMADTHKYAIDLTRPSHTQARDGNDQANDFYPTSASVGAAPREAATAALAAAQPTGDIAGPASAAVSSEGPRVFISYAHDDEEHVDRVRGLWTFRRALGIDAQLDLPAAETPLDWSLWTAEQLRDCHHILVIASPAYKRRAQGQAAPDEGRGVRWEAGLIRALMYEDQRAARRRIIPVVLPGTTVKDLPDWLTPATCTHYLVTDTTISGAEKLVRLLTGQPYETIPELGSVPHLPPRGQS